MRRKKEEVREGERERKIKKESWWVNGKQKETRAPREKASLSKRHRASKLKAGKRKG